jgi:hypothetical protein
LALKYSTRKFDGATVKQLEDIATGLRQLAVKLSAAK